MKRMYPVFFVFAALVLPELAWAQSVNPLVGLSGKFTELLVSYKGIILTFLAAGTLTAAHQANEGSGQKAKRVGMGLMLMYFVYDIQRIAGFFAEGINLGI